MRIGLGGGNIRQLAPSQSGHHCGLLHSVTVAPKEMVDEEKGAVFFYINHNLSTNEAQRDRKVSLINREVMEILSWVM